MLAKRVLVAAILLPIGLVLIYLGGWAYTIAIALVMALAAAEFSNLFRAGGYQPASVLVISAALAFPLARGWNSFELDSILLSFFILLAMTYHLFAYERGRGLAGTDFAVSLAGGLYLGFIGAYLVSLRMLPEGLWWILLVLPAVWLADSGAYFIGRKFGKHKMSKRLSPKKSWEGYFGGLVVSGIGTAVLALLWRELASTFPAVLPQADHITPLAGAFIGLALGTLTVLGDLGESMIKRQFNAKDSGTLLPGHGGVFDRIDSWLWAGVIGYYLVYFALL